MMEVSQASALIVGTGEYTTGYVHGKQSTSDKKIGVIALCLFDLRSPHRGSKVGKIKMVGTNGTKFPGIREHFQKNIAAIYRDMEVEIGSFPADNIAHDPLAYVEALNTMQKGDFVTIFTPDDSHFIIAKESIQRGLHVLLTKPPVKTLKEHIELTQLAKKHNVIVAVEYHKRWDPMYADAKERMRALGDFGFFQSYMSQPKFQLETFKSWAGTSSDISYYLNSHHIDFHCWAMRSIARPIRVVAMQSNGVATSLGLPKTTEDTITLLVQWQNLTSANLGTATYTASWSAPKADVHSQQRFFYMGHKGEINIDQAHRGYQLTTDDNGFASINPLYMKYTADQQGRFSGQNGYGYKSIEAFVDAVNRARSGTPVEEFDNNLATIATTMTTTAILEAGRLSLDHGGCAYIINYHENDKTTPVEIVPE